MQKKAQYTLAELASYLDATLDGDGDCKVSGLASLADATITDISFLSDSKYVAELAGCQAAAVVVSAEHADKVQGNVLVSDNPYLGFAKISCLFDDRSILPAGIDPSAKVAKGVRGIPHEHTAEDQGVPHRSGSRWLQALLRRA